MTLSRQTIQLTSVWIVANVVLKLILVAVEHTDKDPNYDFAVLDLVLTTALGGYLLWAIVTAVRHRNPVFCMMGVLEWYLLVLIALLLWSLFGVIFGFAALDWKVVVPSVLFLLMEGAACASTLQLVTHLHRRS